MKVGFIRCQKTEDICSAKEDFKAVREKKGAFKGVAEDIIIIGFYSCGGCPGDKASSRAAKMVRQGADTIVLTSCITKGRREGEACPYAEEMKEEIVKRLGEKVKIIDHSHK
ncbi:MAG: CGGC domain-containing protein [Bacillota bacterium]|nr:CGGC domain-containing protein [Bacillota bacterium]